MQTNKTSYVKTIYIFHISHIIYLILN